MSTILYIEDDVLTRQSIAGRLRRRGYDVIESESGEEGVEKATGCRHLDAALIDWHLPGINGLEASRRLRQLHPALALVVCSAALPGIARRPLHELGVSDERLVAKPFPFAKLFEILQTALGDHNPAA